MPLGVVLRGCLLFEGLPSTRIEYPLFSINFTFFNPGVG
jgi:hypothetical protein